MARGNRTGRSIGGAGLEQGGPSLGNDYSRDITREMTANNTDPIVVEKNKKQDHNRDTEQNRNMEQKRKMVL